MHILLIILFVALIVGPSLWVKMVIRQHSKDRSDYPGTGGEFARHILDQLGLQHITVEPTNRGDHYDPMEKSVRLSPAHFDGRSLSAVAIAAHEVGHAIQDRDDYKPFVKRLKMVRIEQFMVLGVRFLSLIPLAGAVFSGVPQFAFLILLFFIMTGVVAFGVRLINLDVEFDASFNKALPILENGYLPPEDLPAARTILRAAALTYLSGALIMILRLLFLRR
ncbi:zinc metallopeptidase [Terasakiella sp. A23]|uniref:zinc metallopeptidase n=1 Tax=Terasakiella sp. FCG-A23 TaxID=3080561 RepID=UPI0029551FBD|nr:zinc metallopeptidase [Terasakiella sp. A23]MDV7338217.1 zinc metallopeptidase [Terasakiella sp. A23]